MYKHLVQVIVLVLEKYSCICFVYLLNNYSALILIDRSYITFKRIIKVVPPLINSNL